MADRETLLALKERVEKASGRNDALELDIHRALDPKADGIDCLLCTQSIDAALALCERMLPGKEVQIIVAPDHGLGGYSYAGIGGTRGVHVARPGKCAPLAILSALLSALSQQPAQDGDAG